MPQLYPDRAIFARIGGDLCAPAHAWRVRPGKLTLAEGYLRALEPNFGAPAHLAGRMHTINGKVFPTMTPDQIANSARVGLSALQWLKRVLALVPWRRQFVCVLHPLFSGWVATDGLVHARIVGSVTNTRRHDGMVVYYIEMRRSGLQHMRTWETCPVWNLGDDFPGPGSPGILLKPRTTAAFQAQHPFRVERMPDPKRRFSVCVRVVDQLKRKHRFRVRLRCFHRPPACQAPS